MRSCLVVLALAMSAFALAGGFTAPSSVLKSAPPGTHSDLVGYEWRDGPPLIVARASPAVVVLQNGNILVIGGLTATGPTATTELFDVKLSAWKLGPTMNSKRVGHTATLLKDGTVLVVGGDTGTGATATAEIVDLGTSASALVPSMSFARSGHAAVLLGSGKVLVTGGTDWIKGVWKQAEVFDRTTLTWTPAGSMSSSRLFFSMHLLTDGTALAVGGDANGTSERYNATTNGWSLESKMVSQRYYSASVKINGRVLVAGGIVGDTPVSTSELYDPSGNSWSSTGSMNTPRARFSLTPLPNGDFLAAGSSSKLGTTTSCEVFHPETRLWQQTDSMNTSRGEHGSAVLQNGAVFVIGGKSGTSITSSVETFSAVHFEPKKPCKPIDLVPLVQAATELPGNSSHGLIAKLVAAQAKYDDADFSTCLNIMHAFYNQVRAFARNGHMERAHAAAIYDGYASVVECIGGEPLPPVPEMTRAGAANIVAMRR